MCVPISRFKVVEQVCAAPGVAHGDVPLFPLATQPSYQTPLIPDMGFLCVLSEVVEEAGWPIDR